MPSCCICLGNALEQYAQNSTEYFNLLHLDKLKEIRDHRQNVATSGNVWDSNHCFFWVSFPGRLDSGFK